MGRIRVFCFVVIQLVIGSASVSAYADFESSKGWFMALDPQARFELQANLVLVAGYDGLVDGTFGPSTYNALAAYQTKQNAVADGVLSQQQRDSLEGEAQALFGQLGIDKVTDTDAGIAIYLPGKLLVSQTPAAAGNTYASDDGQIELETSSHPHTEQGFNELFSGMSASANGRTVTYSALGADNFVVSGIDDTNFNVSGIDETRFFYDRFYDDGTSTVGFELRFTAKYGAIGKTLSIFMASFSSSLSTLKERVPNSPPPIKESPQSPQDSTYYAGSGFLFNSQGMLVTNFHVAGNCSTVTIPGYGSAHLLKGDQSVDIAALQIDDTKYRSTKAAVVRTSPPALAESILLLGYPLPDMLNSSLNVSTGIVSAETGMGGQPNWFTTNAGIEPGNSGGPLLDQHGNVVGVAVAKVDDVKLLAQAGTSAPNVGFGINNKTLLSFLSELPHSTIDSVGDEAAKTPQEISAVAKEFTVQIICEKATQPSLTAPPVANSPQSTAPIGQNLAIYAGLDFYGNDISKGRITDAVQCANSCLKNQQCKAFTFNANPAIRSGPNCFLKKDVGRVEAYSTAVSGFLLDSSNVKAPTYEMDAIDPTKDLLADEDFLGENLSNYPYAPANVLDNCRMACIDNNQCEAFTFVSASKRCWLKRSSGDLRALKGAISGRKRHMSIAPADVVSVPRQSSR